MYSYVKVINIIYTHYTCDVWTITHGATNFWLADFLDNDCLHPYIGTKSPTEFSCPAGTYFDQTGNVRIQNCIQCTAGHYCPLASVLPTPCTAGTFSDTLGATVSACRWHCTLACMHGIVLSTHC